MRGILNFGLAGSYRIRNSERPQRSKLAQLNAECRLFLVAFVIARGLAWFFMNNWLQAFAYRIDNGFILAGLVAAHCTAEGQFPVRLSQPRNQF